MVKFAWTGCGIAASCCVALGIHAWNVQSENHRLSMANVIYQAEHRILKDEIAEWEKKPNYDQGFKDAIVRQGGPQTPGAYQDGWDDAMKVIGTQSNYADGYHNAIQQFGYTKTAGMSRWLVEKTQYANNDKKEEVTPVKYGEEKK